MINKNEKLELLSKKIYESYGLEGSAGIDYFSQFESDLRYYDAMDVVLCQSRMFDLSYVMDFMLSLSFLWKDQSTQFWLRLLKRSARPAITDGFEEHGYYSDIYFLCKYLKIDGLKFYLSLDDVSDSDKYETLRYIRKHVCFMVLSELDEEDLDGEYFVEVDVLERVSSKLLKEGGFQPLKLSEEDLAGYVDSLLDKYKK